MPADDHSKHYDTDRPQVGLVIDVPSVPLFRGHIRRRPDDGTTAGKAIGVDLLGPYLLDSLFWGTVIRVSDLSQYFGNAEVEDFYRASLGQENVVGFEIAMSDILLMGANQSADYRHDQLGRSTHRHGALPDDVTERATLEVLEHHEWFAIELIDLVDDDDVLMTTTSSRASLDYEALGDQIRIAVQKLDGHPAAELGVSSQIDGSHSPFAELSNELVLVDFGTGPQLDGWNMSVGFAGAGREQRP